MCQRISRVFCICVFSVSVLCLCVRSALCDGGFIFSETESGFAFMFIHVYVLCVSILEHTV